MNSDRIASDIFPLRPTKAARTAENTRARNELEARAVVRQLTRMYGKMPDGLRFALMAGHENLLCMFDADSVTHWEYLNKIYEGWPDYWDVAAAIDLRNLEVKPKKVKAKIVHPVTVPAKVINLLEEKGKRDGQQASSGDIGHPPSNGAGDGTAGDVTPSGEVW